MWDCLNYTHSPYEHQKRAITEATSALRERGYHALFLDMGTGKTMSTIHTATILQREDPIGVLIICPKPLMGTWHAEIKKHCTVPYSVFRWDSAKSRTKKFRAAFAELKDVYNPRRRLSRLPFFIVNVEAFQTPNAILDTLVGEYTDTFSVLAAIDESSYIKSHDAKRTKRILSWSPNFLYRLILTGTEITSSVLDLYTQFEFLQPGFWKPYRTFYQFRLRYAILQDMQVSEGRKFKIVIGFQNLEEIESRTSMYVTRIRKEDCLDLPSKIYETIEIELNSTQVRMYKELREDLVTKLDDEIITAPAKLQLFMRFRQITGGYMPSGEMIGERNPKIDAIRADSCEYPGKVIVWASFVHEIEALLEELSGDGGAVGLYGKMSEADREEALSAFANEEADSPKYLIANPSVGAYGLNLQFCTLHYYYSRPTQAGQSWQSEDRSHRIGQSEHVVYKDLIAPNTVDERLKEILDKKTDLREMFRSGGVADLLRMV